MPPSRTPRPRKAKDSACRGGGMRTSYARAACQVILAQTLCAAGSANDETRLSRRGHGNRSVFLCHREDYPRASLKLNKSLRSQSLR